MAEANKSVATEEVVEKKAPAKKTAAKKPAAEKTTAAKKPAAKKAAPKKDEAEAAPAKKTAAKKADEAAAAPKKAPAKKAKAVAANAVTVKLVRSLSGRKKDQIATAVSMGLTRVGKVSVQPDNDATRGKIVKISHLVEVTKA